MPGPVRPHAMAIRNANQPGKSNLDIFGEKAGDQVEKKPQTADAINKRISIIEGQR